MNGEQFLDTIYKLSELNDTNGATSLVYSHVDSLLRSNRFSEVDDIFLAAEPMRLTMDAVIGLLAISWRAKPHLNCETREAYSDQVWKRAMQTGEEEYVAEALDRFS